MLFKAKTGVAWRDLPERYGPWKTVYNRFWRWSRTGTLSALVAQVQVLAEAIDELDREVSVDPAPCGRITTPPALDVSRCLTQGANGSCGGQSEPGDHAIGRPRGGLTTKIHLACDGHGRPLSIVLTGGNVNDCTQFTTVMAGVEFRSTGPGRPARRPS